MWSPPPSLSGLRLGPSASASPGPRRERGPTEPATHRRGRAGNRESRKQQEGSRKLQETWGPGKAPFTAGVSAGRLQPEDFKPEQGGGMEIGIKKRASI